MKYALKYNAFHNLESIGIDGKAESLIKYTYKNGNGRLKEISYANGDKMSATYNSVGQLVAEKWFNKDNALIAHYKYVYDNSGNIVRSIDICAKKEYNYIYNEGTLIEAITYSIEFNGENIVGKTVTDNIRYVYDSDGNMTRKIITAADGKSFVYNFETADDKTVVKFDAVKDKVSAHSKSDSFGRKIFDELQLGSGFISRQFEYVMGTSTEEHTDSGKLKSSPTTQLVSRILLSDGRTIEYEYDAEERITKVIDSVDGTTEYTYDALGQLLTERLNGHIINSMTYDTYGNIISKNGQTYFYDSTWHDLLTGIESESIEYDAQGNPVKYLGHTLTWEKGRQLKSFDNNTYTYNANGIRTSKTVNGVKHEYTLDGTKILKETWGDNTLIPLYDNEDSVCGIIYNDYAYYFLKNLQGDVISITNNKGKVVASYSYDAWGVCTIVSDNTGIIARVNPFRYRGYYYDVEIGLYYLQSRYYDPRVCRFINVDEAVRLTSTGFILEKNGFSYAWNSPIIIDDASGYFPSLGDIIIGAISGVAFEYVGIVIANLIDRFLSGSKITKKIFNPFSGSVWSNISTSISFAWAGVEGALDFACNTGLKFDVIKAVGSAILTQGLNFLNKGTLSFKSLFKDIIWNLISYIAFKKIEKKLSPEKGKAFNQKIRNTTGLKGQKNYDKMWNKVKDKLKKKVYFVSSLVDTIRNATNALIEMFENFLINCISAVIDKYVATNT